MILPMRIKEVKVLQKDQNTNIMGIMES